MRDSQEGGSGVMEKGSKGKAKSEREAMSWLGSGSDRPTLLTFHPLGMEASGNSRGAPPFRARRYVCKEPIFP